MSRELLLDLSFLTEEERDIINNVISKDVEVRKQEQSRISTLREQLDELKENGLPEEEIETKNDRYCARCQTYFGIILNRGSLCLRCNLKVCKVCRENVPEDGWMCTLCAKVREVKAQSGAWFFQSHKTKEGNLFGSILVRKSLRRLPNSPKEKRQDNHQPVLNTDHDDNDNEDYDEFQYINDEYMGKQDSLDEDPSKTANALHNLVNDDRQVTYSDSDEASRDDYYSAGTHDKSQSREGESDGSESLEFDHLADTTRARYPAKHTGREIGSHGEPDLKQRVHRDTGEHGQSIKDTHPVRERIRSFDLDDIYYTPAPKFNISTKRRTMTEGDDPRDISIFNEKSHEREDLTRDFKTKSRELEAQLRNVNLSSFDHAAQSHDYNTQPHEEEETHDLKPQSRESEAQPRDIKIPSGTASTYHVTTTGHKTTESRPKAQISAANLPQRRKSKDEIEMDSALKDDVEETSKIDDLGCKSGMKNYQGPSTSLFKGTDVTAAVKGSEEISVEKEQVVESSSNDMSDVREGRKGFEKREENLGDQSDVEETTKVPSVLARVKTWEHQSKESKFSPPRSELSNLNVKKLIGEKMKVELIKNENKEDVSATTKQESFGKNELSVDIGPEVHIGNEEKVTDSPRNITASEMLIEESAENDVGILRDHYDVGTSRDKDDVEVSQDEKDVEVFPEQDDVEVSHDQYDVEVSPDQDDVEVSSDQDDVEVSPDQDDVEVSPDQDDVEVSPDQDDVEVSPDQDDVEVSPDQYDVEVSPDQYDVEVSPDQDDVEVSPDQDDVEVSPDQYDVEVSPDQYDVEVSPDQDDVEVSPDQDDVEVSSDQYDVEVSPDQDDVEVSPDQYDVEVSPDQDDVEVSPDQYDVEVSPDQYDVEVSPDQYHVKVSREQYDVDVSPDQDDVEVSVNQHEVLVSQNQHDVDVSSHLDVEPASHDQDDVEIPADHNASDISRDLDGTLTSRDQDVVDITDDQDLEVPCNDEQESPSVEEPGNEYYKQSQNTTIEDNGDDTYKDSEDVNVEHDLNNLGRPDTTSAGDPEVSHAPDVVSSTHYGTPEPATAPEISEASPSEASLDSREDALFAFSQTFSNAPQPSGAHGERHSGSGDDGQRVHQDEGEHNMQITTPTIITPKEDNARRSTHSSIIEYEEDLDVSFSKYGSDLGNKKLKDQLSMGSRESIASYYSNAGGEVYGKYPVTGEIYFGMKYDAKAGEFHVQIHQAREITAVDEKNRVSDPYVKTYLLPDRTRGGKRKTKVKKNTINPVFDEILSYKISYDEILHRTLWLAVWNHDRFGHNDFLGEVLVPIDEYQQSGFSLEDPEPQWYHLNERQEENPDLSYNGEIVFALKYVPPSAVMTKKKKKKKKEEKGQLHINIIEASNLLAKDSNGFSDPFCKSYLLPDKSKKTKQKTAVVKKSLNPKWNYQYVYENINQEELMDRVLELTVWDFDRGSSNEFLGGLRLGLGAGLQEWDDANSEEQAAWNKMLNNPNHWNQVTLPLRDHMGNAK